MRHIVHARPMWEGVQIADPLPILDGGLTIDGTAPIARQGTLTILDKDGTLTPRHSSSRLAPYGAEVGLWGGWITDGDPLIAHDTFARPNGPLGTPEVGPPYRTLGAAWEIVGGAARKIHTTAIRTGVAVIDANTPNVRASVRLREAWYAGLSLRVIDADNLLIVRTIEDTGEVAVSRKDNLVFTNLARWPRPGRIVTQLAAIIDGERITVWANEERLGTVTLSSADLAKYAQGTAHGMWSYQSFTAQPDTERFDDLRIEYIDRPPKITMDPLGVLRLDVTTARHDATGTIVTVRGQDRAASVSANGFRRTTTLAKGADIVDRIASGITEVLPGTDLSQFEEAVYLAPRLLVWEEDADPWEAWRKLAASIGMELFWDAEGLPVLRTVPSTVNTAPVADYVEGRDGVESIERTWDAQQGYNRYVVVGADANRNPVRGVWADTDFSSPTYFGGPFGRRTAPTVHMETVGSKEQAEAAARGLVMRDRGGTEVVEVTAKVDWRRTFGDVVRLESAALNLNESAVVEHVDLGLSPERLMRFVTSAKRTVVEETLAANEAV